MERKIVFNKICKLVDSNTLIINFDESSLGENTKQNYWWRIRGHPIESKVISIIESISQWTALFSNGNWLSMITSNSFKSKCFILFLKHFIKMINDNNNFGFNKTILIMNNWFIHKLNKVKNFCKRSKFQCILHSYIYSPLNTKEIFFELLKKRIWI